MKKLIFFSLVFASSIFLSACTLQEKVKTAQPPETVLEVTAAPDDQVFKEFDKDQDQDFTKEFNQLNSDLE